MRAVTWAGAALAIAALGAAPAFAGPAKARGTFQTLGHHGRRSEDRMRRSRVTIQWRGFTCVA
jgi:hypothetical protein